MSEKIVIDLTKEEALVFFEWLVRFNESENTPFILGEVEKQVLFDIESLLEKKLSEPFSADYENLVETARAQVQRNVVKSV